MILYYKIVALRNGQHEYLFHGINGSKVIPKNTWITADIKENVSDGVGTKYTSGIHIVSGRENAEEYLKRFRRQDRVIIQCYAKGLRHKTKSKPYVFLADEIMVPDFSNTIFNERSEIPGVGAVESGE